MYFIEMCNAISAACAAAAPTLPFITQDKGFTASPVIPGVGTGVTLQLNAAFMREQMYTLIRNAVLSTFGKTTHEPYMPSSGNLSGQFLYALCDGICQAVATHFNTAGIWTLISQHPIVYQGVGKITYGNIQQPTASLFQPAGLSASPNFIGKFWPIILTCIGQAYNLSITTQTSGQVTITGQCVSSGSQTCQIYIQNAAGTGIAA
jgi:hypothetical protein